MNTPPPDGATIASAYEWAFVVSRYMRKHDLSARDVLRRAHAEGRIEGVTLSPKHPLATADNLVGQNPHPGWGHQDWVIGYDLQVDDWRDLQRYSWYDGSEMYWPSYCISPHRANYCVLRKRKSTGPQCNC
ncbi:hypothetical protein [Streptomyces sp. NRRL F-2890]|uniref:hypothetical protein n=1 Tax=Streptomyces sp. NRRL F-2890 TaxID=1463845 RepID=UPI0004C62198|nr:hypothetical protein [Streptomyces sp. NRRL F-2890]